MFLPVRRRTDPIPQTTNTTPVNYDQDLRTGTFVERRNTQVKPKETRFESTSVLFTNVELLKFSCKTNRSL